MKAPFFDLIIELLFPGRKRSQGFSLFSELLQARLGDCDMDLVVTWQRIVRKTGLNKLLLGPFLLGV